MQSTIPPVRQPDSLFSWSEEFAIGHRDIDADHQRIFDIAHRLQQVASVQADDALIGDTLYELIEYTRDHFRREESHMLAMQYAGLAAHRLEHNLLLHHVGRLHQKFVSGEDCLGHEVLDLLRQWLINHILQTDLEMIRSQQGDRG